MHDNHIFINHTIHKSISNNIILQSNTWTQIADMLNRRRNAGVASVNGLLYVVGGDDGSSNLNSVEYYNPQTDSWIALSTTMEVARR